MGLGGGGRLRHGLGRVTVAPVNLHPVAVGLDQDALDVLDALAYVERHRGRAGAARAIINERVTHLLKHDKHIRMAVLARRVAREAETGQARLPIDTGVLR